MHERRAYAYRPEIDGIRALAVAAVVMNHLSADSLPGGFLGVDIFFVVSGFVVTMSVDRAVQNKSLGAFLLDFYSRRVRRILPALLFFVVAMSVVAARLESFAQESIWTGIFSLFGLSNIYLLYREVDYFGGRADLNFFTHTWSLGVEEQFYAILPLIAWLCIRRDADGSRRYVVCAVSVLSLISFLTFVTLSQLHPPAAYYLLPSRFWEIGIGVLAFYVWRRKAEFSISSVYPLAAALVLGLTFLPGKELQLYSTPVAVVSAAVLIISLSEGSLLYRVFTWAPIRLLGLISFSVYLWHWGVISVARYTIGVNQNTILWLLAAILVLSALSYWLVELPLRRARPALPSGIAITAGAAGAALGAVFAGAVPSLIGEIGHREGPAPLIKAGVATLIDEYTFEGRPSWSGGDCALYDNNHVGKLIEASKCTLAPPGPVRRRMLVVGNSFSAAFVEMFAVIPRNLPMSVTITSTWGASVTPNFVNTGMWDKANNYYWEIVIPSLINDMKSGDIVMMVNDLAGHSPAVPVSDLASYNTIASGLGKFATDMASRGISVGFLHGLPFMRDANCTPSLAARGSCQFFSRESTLARRARVDGTLRQVAATHPNFHILDLMDVFCPGPECSFHDGSIYLYRDEFSHPSVEAARRSQPKLLEFIREISSKAQG